MCYIAQRYAATITQEDLRTQLTILAVMPMKAGKPDLKYKKWPLLISHRRSDWPSPSAEFRSEGMLGNGTNSNTAVDSIQGSADLLEGSPPF